jgi:glutathione S-transferase
MLGQALLYDLHASPACALARACLQIAGVSYRRVPLGEQRGRQRGDPVPVLVTDAGAVAGGPAIVALLEGRRLGPALRPDDARARVYCGLLEQWAQDSLGPAIGALVWSDERACERLADGISRELAPRGPRFWLRGRVRRTARAWYRVTRPDAPLAGVQARLDLLGALLGDQAHLLGGHLTLADVSAYVQVVRLRVLEPEPAIAWSPIVTRWLARLDAIPAVATAVSP